MIVLNLPMPPSVNELFANLPSRGRIPTRKYKAWQQEAGWQLVAQRQSPITGRVWIDLKFGPGAADLDNRAKAIIDLLVKHKLIEDDGPKYVRKLWLEIDDSLNGCRVAVRHGG